MRTCLREVLVARFLGLDTLRRYLGVTYTDVFMVGARSYKFSAQQRKKIKFLFEIVNVLRGSYSDNGVGDWFFRTRKILGDKSPNDILSDNWTPKGELPQKILELAQNLRDGNAT